MTNKCFTSSEIKCLLKTGMPESYFIQPEGESHYFPLFESEKTAEQEKHILNLEEPEEEDINNLLKQNGFYDSTDKRSCQTEKIK